ncbi:CaiB/BaiF CoA-transferase family protein [Hydrogenophaga sp.]|uniref:CaiB/BaiF CoA transferase family protein n=1 Tax=Hydrogenophaga sp. TaxID=1904254 RepID=UPI00262E05E9|nr:CaiB/BaiF CoA-transferase family protein [Hydrogenophaga sp.]MCW5654272.1 CoA transferase [Hydrogenophaga sp.]
MGPLADLKIVEFAAIGPVPMCGMLMADAGATVLRIDRTKDVELGTRRPPRFELLKRGRTSVALDAKSPEGRALILEIVRNADVLLEGFRPGVMERLGLGPEPCLEVNPRLVYARMTGWGQTGPLAHVAAHDINYVALTGALAAMGRKEGAPAVPLNLVGDFGGGALYLAFGVLAAVMEARGSGRGQVVDCAITDGVLSLMTMFFGARAAGMWNLARASNVIDSGAPFYDVYECADGGWVSIGAIETRFYDELVTRMGLNASTLPDRSDRQNWTELRQIFEQVFRQKSRDQWCEILEGTDSCFAPVLDMDEALVHPHLKARAAFESVDGVVQPVPAPRFSRTPTAVSSTVPRLTGREALRAWLGEERLVQFENENLLAPL